MAQNDSIFPFLFLFFVSPVENMANRRGSKFWANCSLKQGRLHEWSEGFMFPCKASQFSSPLKQRYILITCSTSGCRVVSNRKITPSTLIALHCSWSNHARQSVWSCSLSMFYITGSFLTVSLTERRKDKWVKSSWNQTVWPAKADLPINSLSLSCATSRHRWV